MLRSGVTHRMCVGLGLMALLTALPARALQISEIMYHPPVNEAQMEYVEIYNETAADRDLGGWRISGGIDYVFPLGTVLASHEYLVVAIDPAALMTSYSITNVLGPFTGRLDNGSERIRLRDKADGIITEVTYADDGKWPTAADGTGHSLAKFVMRGDPDDPDYWRASPQMGGSPGRDNGFQPWYEDRVIIPTDATWKYFKGVSEASTPIDDWRKVGYDDSGAQWLSGQTGIGYGDGDDATLLTDMQNGYWSIYCRYVFSIPDPTAVDQLLLELDHDDGFIAYLNGPEVGRAYMSVMAPTPVYFDTPAMLHAPAVEGGTPTFVDMTAYKSQLNVGDNVLAVQVHNNTLGSSDLTFIPRLVSRTMHTPGSANFPVLINEVKFNTSGTQYIELYNKSAGPVDVGNFLLSNVPDMLDLYQIPSPTVIPGGGYVTFDSAQLGFTMTAVEDRIFFSSPSATLVLDARAVEAGPKDFTEGRWPDGGKDWYYMDPTTGTANAVNLSTDIVINEIMYHPPTDLSADEFIEIYNKGPAPVNLGGWRFSRGVTYDFTSTQTIGAGEYRVIAKDRDNLIARYSLDPAIVWGNYVGQLSNAGERVRLRDANNNVADEVIYHDSGQWHEEADGYGSSLELVDPNADNSNWQAWAPSDETAQSGWTQFSYTANPSVPGDTNEHELHFHLMGPGEVLIDNVRLQYSGSDYIPNWGFESGVGNWVIMGNHVQSHIYTADKYAGNQCLKIVSTGRGDTGANHIEQDASPSLTSGQGYTISFWARWLRGNRVLVTRLWDNQMPETHMLPIPTLTGTPGAVNSTVVANLGPVADDVEHAPAVPRGTEAVTVTAELTDPDGVASALLYYKADSDGAYASVSMFDDGAHNDGAAGDGTWAGEIPARAAGNAVAFYIESTDGAAQTNTWPTDTSAPALYRVEGAPMGSSFPRYRIITTQADQTELTTRPPLSNEPLNCTFIFNETDVYYNCGMRWIGSPFHRGRGNPTGYKVTFQPHNRLHGIKELARTDSNPGGGYHDRLSYLMQDWMGLAHCQLEWVAVKFNGNGVSVLEDTLPPGNQYLEIYYRGDADGPLFELDDRFRFDSNNDLDQSSFNNFNTDFSWQGTDKDPYRHNFDIRNWDNIDDYTSIVVMLDVMNNTPGALYEQEVAKVINVEQWFRLFAVRACISDWDFYAFQRGKNSYLYWPLVRKRWDVLGWDSELTFANVNMSIWSSFSTVRRFQQTGGHPHYYYHYLKEMLDKYFTRAALDPWIDEFASVYGGNPNNEKSFIDARRAYLLGLLPTATCNILTNGGLPFTVTVPEVGLTGTAPPEVRWIRVDGVQYYPRWTNATTWGETFPLVPGPNTLLLEFLDYDGNLVGTDSIVVTFNGPFSVEDWKDY